MRILSAKLQNYRIHNDLEVDLDPDRTLIGGLNESGKSTLIEAIHRGLFLKAKATGPLQESMLPRSGQGNPEVSVCFEADGRTYQVAKRFSKASGTTTLSEEGGSSLHGDAAETRLAEILGVDEIGRVTADRLRGQWAHLWVWQGQAGEDPSGHATKERDSLLARLRDDGAAVAVQSALDGAVAARFAEQEKELFTNQGKPKANSTLHKALEELQQAEQEVSRTREAVDRLRQAADDLRRSTSAIDQQAKAIEDLASQRDKVQARSKQVDALQAGVRIKQITAQQRVSKHQDLVTADQEIVRLTKEIAKSADKLEPVTAQLKRLEASEKTRKQQLKVAEKSLRDIDRQVRSTRSHVDLLKAWIEHFEAESEAAALQKSAAAISKLKKQLAKLEKARAGLPELDEAALKSLQSLVGKQAKARATLEAMAAGIEVISAGDGVEVLVGESALAVGERRILDEDTQIQVGEAAALRITPGGGTSLADARNRLEECENALAAALDKIGVASHEEAAESLAKRQRAELAIKTTAVELNGEEADTLEERQSAVAARLEAARSEIDRRSKKLEAATAPKTEKAARTALGKQQAALDELEAREQSTRADRDAASQACEDAVDQLVELQKSIEGAKAALEAQQTRLTVLEETHGKASARSKALENLLAERKGAEDELAEAEKALQALQPESIEADLDRLTRALQKADEQHRAAEQSRAVARNILISDGSLDPEEALASSQAKVESASNRHQNVERKAHAIRLLAELFAAEQLAHARQFTRPLVEKVSTYLQQLFGPEATAAVALEGNKFGGLQLTRAGKTFAFETLSGGAREQLAAAVRLAIAEVLAEDHGGCLPVVFDDAFTNSDPERVQNLQRMLDHAARQGLQVILLTCNPAEYSALGATTVSLS